METRFSGNRSYDVAIPPARNVHATRPAIMEELCMHKEETDEQIRVRC